MLKLKNVIVYFSTEKKRKKECENDFHKQIIMLQGEWTAHMRVMNRNKKETATTKTTAEPSSK